MKKHSHFNILLLCLLFAGYSHAQTHPGFSRVYSSNLFSANDPSPSIDVLLYDSTRDALYFGMNIKSRYTKFYKTGTDGTEQAVYYDTAANQYISYTAAASDGSYIYWAGKSQSKLKVLKTDMNLAKVWEKKYNLPANADKKQQILMMHDGNLLLSSGNIWFSQLYKLDTTGNVLYSDTVKDFVRGLTASDNEYLTSLANKNRQLDTSLQTTWNKDGGGNAIIRSKEEGEETFYIASGSYRGVEELIDGGYMNGSLQKITRAGQSLYTAIYTKYTAGSSVYTMFDGGYRAVCNANANGCIAAGSTTHFNTAPFLFGEINRVDTALRSLWNNGYTHTPGMPSGLVQVVSLPDGSFVASGWAETAALGQQGWLLRVDSSGCTDSTCSGIIPAEPLSVSAVPADEFNIFPNPAQDILNIHLKQPFLSDAFVRITDLAGRSLQQMALPKGKSRLTIDVSRWPNSLYLLTIEKEGKRYYQKISVRH